MPAGGLVTLGAGAILGGINWAQGAHQKNLARKAALANVRPTYQTPQSEQDLYNLTASQAGTGMSDASRQVYQNSANQGLGSVLAAIGRGGGDPNAISSAYGNYETGISKMALQDDALRMQHLNEMREVYARQTANKDKEWQLNQFDPYKDKAQAISQQLQGAQQQQTAGMNMLGSSLLSGLQNLSAPQKSYVRDQSNDASMQPLQGYAQSGRPNYNVNTPSSFTPKDVGFTPMYATGNSQKALQNANQWDMKSDLFGGALGY